MGIVPFNLAQVLLDSQGVIGCPEYSDQGLVIRVKLMFLASALLAFIAIALLIIRKRPMRKTIYFLMAVVIIGISLVLLHRTDACGHGGLFVDHPVPFLVLAPVIFISTAVVMVKSMLSKTTKEPPSL